MKTKGKSKRQRQEENKERMKRRRIEDGTPLNFIIQDDRPVPTAEAQPVVQIYNRNSVLTQ